MWHSTQPAQTEMSTATELPLTGLAAWRVYLRPPLTSGATREALVAAEVRCADDLLANVVGPTVTDAAARLPQVLAELRRQLPLDAAPLSSAARDAAVLGTAPLGDAMIGNPLGLVGGGLGATVAQLVLAEIDAPVYAAALIDPVVQLRGALPHSGCETACRWREAARRIADRLDFLQRAGTILARRPRPAVMVLTDAGGDAGMCEPAERLWSVMSTYDGAPERASLVTVPDIRHAPTVDAAVTDWFRRHLPSAA